MKRLSVYLFLSLCLIVPVLAFAEDPSYTIVIKNHMFEPAETKIPANQKVSLIIDNQDPTPEEFESKKLKREKVVQGNSKITVLVGPLTPGEYKFYGEFHEKTAKGKIIVE